MTTLRREQQMNKMADESKQGLSKRISNFQDKKTQPDAINEYIDSLQSNQTPLLIDNGSFECRVGWMSDQEPRLMFRNAVAKSRGKKDGEMEILVGNDIGNIELVRWSLKSQFDRDVITHYDAQEQMFDHIFSRLGINTQGSVNHPVVMTESVCNPNYSRQSMNELLFECYHVPQVTYGIDSLYSLYYNQHSAKKYALIVSSGYQVSHVLPVVDGKLDARSCKRLNLGGSHCIGFMQRLLQLKYPSHAAQITLSRAQEIVHNHTYIATDYHEELSHWQDEDYSNENERVMQLTFTQPAGAPNGGVKDEEKEKLRREKQGRRLQEINCKKQQEKLVEEEKRLKHLSKIRKLESHKDKFSNALAKEGFQTAEELQLTIDNLSTVVKKRREKVKKLRASMEAVKKQDSSSARGEKKGSVLGEDVAKKSKNSAMSQEMKEWLDGLRLRRKKILDARQQRQQRKDELSNRRSAASIERMRMISKLAHDPNIRDDGSLRGGHKKPKEDTFGMNDDDWMVYRHISKDAGDSDSEKEQEQLGEIENVLKKHDPNFQSDEDKTQVIDLESYHQLSVGIERFRAPEVIFQPSMLGVDQAGLAEIIEFILNKYPPDIQNQLVQNIFVTGGNAQHPNFCSRLERELLAMRPFQSTFKVCSASNLSLDAWFGMRQWVSSLPNLNNVSTTRQDYDEKGGEYLKEHQLSNPYVATPGNK